MFTPRRLNAGVATTISTTPEHPAVNVEFHTENSAGSQATLAQQTVLHFTPASHSQSENGDLDRQLARLTEYAHDHGWSVENTYTDIGSDLDEDHRGLNPFSMTYRKPTTDAFSSLIKIDSPVGFSYLKRHFDYYAITVTIIEDGTDKSAREELVDDLIKLVASFSGKLYGMCSSKKQQVVNTVESEVKPDE